MAIEVQASHTQALINTLQSIGGGHMIADAAEKMQQAVKAAMLEGASTSITIKIEFKKSTPESLTIKGSSNVKIPVFKPAAMFFVTDTYLPSRERPAQQLMNYN